jgi:superfamily I DNA/RNA helicase
MGCIEGMIPDVDYKLSPKAQEATREEQRRLFYVALTQPTETLMLSSVTYIPMDQALGMGLPGAQVIASFFLGELGPDKPKPVAGHTLL